MKAHQPLSETLVAIVAEECPPSGWTLNELLRHTEGRGPYALVILLCLPFITPISLPGVSNAFGLAMLLLAIQVARNHPPGLPKFIGDRTLPPERLGKIVRGSAKFLRFVEKWVKPRRTNWLTGRRAQCGNALVIAVMASLLALPIPPTIPLSNMLPSYAIILLAASMMEEDGKMIWVAYSVTFATFIYIVSMTILQAGALVALYVKYYERVIAFFRGLI